MIKNVTVTLGHCNLSISCDAVMTKVNIKVLESEINTHTCSEQWGNVGTNENSQNKTLPTVMVL